MYRGSGVQGRRWLKPRGSPSNIRGQSAASPTHMSMQLHRAFRFAAFAALIAAPVLAQKGNAVNIPFETMRLPNGLEVILAPDPTVPQVTVDVWYHVGSKNKVTGRTGFAHIFE